MTRRQREEDDDQDRVLASPDCVGARMDSGRDSAGPDVAPHPEQEGETAGAAARRLAKSELKMLRRVSAKRNAPQAASGVGDNWPDGLASDQFIADCEKPSHAPASEVKPKDIHAIRMMSAAEGVARGFIAYDAPASEVDRPTDLEAWLQDAIMMEDDPDQKLGLKRVAAALDGMRRELDLVKAERHRAQQACEQISTRLDTAQSEISTLTKQLERAERARAMAEGERDEWRALANCK